MMEMELKNAPSGPPRDFFEPAGELIGIGGLKYLNETVKSLPLELKGTTLESSVNVDNRFPHVVTGVQSAYLSMGAMFFSRGSYIGKYETEERVDRQSQIVDALERYQKEKGHYPPASITGGDGKPLLSLRVAILPYMGHKELYAQFKLDKPWDSPNNRKLITRMPYQYSGYNSSREGPRTGIQFVVGQDALFIKNGILRKDDVQDRKDQAVLLIQIENSDYRVLWTKPEDFAYDAKKPVPKLRDAAQFQRPSHLHHGWQTPRTAGEFQRGKLPNSVRVPCAKKRSRTKIGRPTSGRAAISKMTSSPTSRTQRLSQGRKTRRSLRRTTRKAP